METTVCVHLLEGCVLGDDGGGGEQIVKLGVNIRFDPDLVWLL